MRKSALIALLAKTHLQTCPPSLLRSESQPFGEANQRTQYPISRASTRRPSHVCLRALLPIRLTRATRRSAYIRVLRSKRDKQSTPHESRLNLPIDT